MRLRLVDLSLIALATIGPVFAACAGELDQVRLRGSNAYDAAPAYPASYPAASGPTRPVAVAAPAAQLHGFTFEFGTRYWFSTGKLAKDLFDDPRSSANLNSRLTYSGLTAGTFEGFGRAGTAFGSFFKGYAGCAGLTRARSHA